MEMALQKRFEEFLHKRAPPKTFCPSEVARALTADELAEDEFGGWRDAMESVREVAWRFRDEGRCEILQKGVVVESDVRIDDIKGPIRIRRK